MTVDLTTNLLQLIDQPVARHTMLERYYSGSQPLAFLAPEARKALGDRLGRMSSNIPRLAVNSVAERLRVVGFSGVDVWGEWLRGDLDQFAPVLHREALLLGTGYALVWAGADGRPQVSIESARQCSMILDPGTRQPIAAAKRWTTDTTTEATIFEPHQITRLRANNTGATTAGFKVVDQFENVLGVVPLVRFANTDRILGDPVSEIDDLIPLVDGLNKTLADMLVGSEFYARPRRWATGLELEEREQLDENGAPVLDGGEPVMETVNPIEENDRMAVNESPEGGFGSFPASDLASYESSVKILISQIMAVSSLPAHFLGVLSSQPPNADALRATEAALVARAEARQQVFGRSWEQVAKLIVAVRDGADPDTVEARVKWADPATRSVAQEADAVTKLFAAGLLPADYALAKLGYSDDEIAEIRTARRTEQLDKAAVDGLGAA